MPLNLGDTVIYDPINRVKFGKLQGLTEPWANRVGKVGRIVFEPLSEDDVAGVLFDQEQKTVYPLARNLRKVR